MKSLMPIRCTRYWRYPSRLSRHYYLWLRPLSCRREFRACNGRLAVHTQKLGDIGEGITECMLNMWFVEEGAHVEEWDKLCEMQSDKAAVEISANFSGVIKKLYAQADDMVKTGAPLVDIDDGIPEPKQPLAEARDIHNNQGTLTTARNEPKDQAIADETHGDEDQRRVNEDDVNIWAGRQSRLATPAVRGLLKEHKVDITQIKGSGKDGRVLKEDVQAFIENLNDLSVLSPLDRLSTPINSKQCETAQNLTPTQLQMFRTMTASLHIPQFLFADEVNVNHLTSLRARLNHQRASSDPRLTLLSFILKAVSMSLTEYPILNARVDTTSDSSKPRLVYRTNHNIGVAMDTPAGLLVPVVKNAAALSILDIAREIRRLSDLGRARKLSNADLSDGTISVSNIGNIGGTVVAPVIVDNQVTILGIGKSRALPVFGEGGTIEKAEMTNFSWSADHRVVDGATMARMACSVKKFIEEPETLMVMMR